MFQKPECTQFKISDVSVSNNKARTHTEYIHLSFIQGNVQQRLYMEVKGS